MGKGAGHERRRWSLEPVADEFSVWTPKGLAAVIDTSVFVAARLSKSAQPAPPREIIRAAGAAYDSFTSLAILGEVERVLARPKFNYAVGETRLWLDPFIRRSRQVSDRDIPGNYAGALRDDEKDNPVLKTALAVNIHEEGQRAISAATQSYGCFIVSLDNDFQPGRNVWGWTFIRPIAFWGMLRAID
ncbi:MAG: PIN domain-containing protein [Chloroflexi bacterium]|nr:PIN domain-containing protein [Chloroflexota bacterium]